MSSESIQLSAFPEELLERVLAPCVLAGPERSASSRSLWHQHVAGSTPAATRGRLAPLLVCRLFRRIATPLFYHTIRLDSAEDLHALLAHAIRPYPFLASHIKHIHLGGIWAEGGELLSLCGSQLRLLDVSLDATLLCPALVGNVRDFDAEEFCEPLKDLTGLTDFVLAKPGSVYLTQPKARYVLAEIARAMMNWNQLVRLPFLLFLRH